jgi:DNA-binding XRE family transcriptional regulator
LTSGREPLNAWLMYSKRQTEIWPTPRLIRAARGLVGIDQVKLAEEAGVTRLTVLKIESDENDKMDPRRLKVLQSLQRVFEDVYGIEFFAASKNSGEGLRFRKK